MKRLIIIASLVLAAIIFNPVDLPFERGETAETNGKDFQGAGDTAPAPAAQMGNSLQHLPCIYYDEKDFYASISQYKTSTREEDSNLLGGIVTHHILASSLMAQFFSTMAAELPDTIIIIGPNHKRFGNSPVHTGKWAWDTAFGTVQIDEGVESRIIEDLGGHEDYSLLENEHSVSTLIPYVSYYFPNAEIVPILLHGNLGMDGCIRLVELLEPVFREKHCLLISSIDFSHYLTPEKAYEMDELTMKAIGDRDYGKIMKMGNDNLDTPPTLVVTLMLMDRLGSGTGNLLAHKNSSDITGTWAESTTSYLIYSFEK